MSLPQDVTPLILAYLLKEDISEEAWLKFTQEEPQLLQLAVKEVLSSYSLRDRERGEKILPSIDNALFYVLCLQKEENINERLLLSVGYCQNYFVNYFLDSGADIHHSHNKVLRRIASYLSTLKQKEESRVFIQNFPLGSPDPRGIQELFLDQVGIPKLTSNRGHVSPNFLYVENIRKERLSTLNLLFDRGAEVNDPAFLDDTVSTGNVETAQLLLERKADFVTKRRDFLYTAIIRGHRKMTGFLLDLPGEDIKGELLIQSCVGHLKIVQLLVERKADCRWGDDSPLIVASSRGKTKIVQYLLEQKADVHTGDERPLLNAISTQNVDTVKLLLDYRADPLAQGGLLLKMGRETQNSEIIKVLFQKSKIPKFSM